MTLKKRREKKRKNRRERKREREWIYRVAARNWKLFARFISRGPFRYYQRQFFKSKRSLTLTYRQGGKIQENLSSLRASISSTPYGICKLAEEREKKWRRTIQLIFHVKFSCRRRKRTARTIIRATFSNTYLAILFVIFFWKLSWFQKMTK